MDWITHIITFIVGLGAGWSIRIMYSSRKNVDNRTVTQNSNNVTNGSVVAGNQDSSH